MPAADPTHLMVLLVVVAVVSGSCGWVGSSMVRRNRRRARGYFVLGFLGGLTAGTIRRWRRRGRRALRTAPFPRWN